MSKTAWKQALKSAKWVKVTNCRYPDLSGIREVVKVQSNALSLKLPVDHPRYDKVPDGSWTYWDPTDRMDGNEYVHIDPNTGAIMARYEIVEAAS